MKNLFIKKIVTPTITAGAYSSGDNVGGKMTFQIPPSVNGGRAQIRSVTLTDKAKQQVDTDIVIFDSDPTSTTFTDNVEMDIDDSDLDKIILNEDLRTHNPYKDNGISQNLSLQTAVEPNTSYFATIVTRGTPTYASTSDLSVVIIIEYYNGQ